MGRVRTVKKKEISLPRLDRLHPTLESTVLKLLEEAGELAQAVGKFRGLNGENVSMSSDEVLQLITRELLDVAQTTVSMMFVLEEEYDIDLTAAIEQHIQKLVAKGYLEKNGAN
ncbi:MAG TPA: nucleotide pyrophosphohydrolase [Firmicutes bacterium]|nr:nucleotide pyrophosphohydrolase [Bacillota bacterium]